ncbi:hypothetical protein [Marinibacterium profundimaris]|uniref:DUF2059 domain-containing protein n=1 Tax=Marinibacterium profundimaris TaxID=1679460 RepID=A0A225NQP4_9RHOB|nr:hypothetical protein [Marinibacterium profundimaris]OWU77284.1 hypothetical protein ATO3_00675 [Marinibacterium profundimaris]
MGRQTTQAGAAAKRRVAGSPVRHVGLPALLALALTFLVALAPRVAADGPAQALTDALRLEELAGLIRAEGLADAGTFVPPGPSGKTSDDTLARIEALFNPAMIRAEMQAALAAGMERDAQIRAMNFFDAPRGKSLVRMELDARAAISDPDVEAIARSDWAMRQDDSDQTIQLLKRFAEVNSLVERNTASTMTARYHFLCGLAVGAGGIPDEDAILSQVWSRQDMIRADTENWLMGYLMMAYAPADDADLKAYVAFSETPAGQAMNAALFDGFEAAYARISYGLGLIAGQATLGQEL